MATGGGQPPRRPRPPPDWRKSFPRQLDGLDDFYARMENMTLSEYKRTPRDRDTHGKEMRLEDRARKERRSKSTDKLHALTELQFQTKRLEKLLDDCIDSENRNIIVVNLRSMHTCMHDLIQIYDEYSHMEFPEEIKTLPEKMVSDIERCQRRGFSNKELVLSGIQNHLYNIIDLIDEEMKPFLPPKPPKIPGPPLPPVPRDLPMYEAPRLTPPPANMDDFEPLGPLPPEVEEDRSRSRSRRQPAWPRGPPRGPQGGYLSVQRSPSPWTLPPRGDVDHDDEEEEPPRQMSTFR